MYIDQAKIFEKTNGGLDIILRYYPQAEPAVNKKGHKFKLRENEKTASSTLKQLDDGNWVVTDFGGSQTSKNAIHICMDEETLTYGEAIRKLAADFNIDEDAASEVYKPEISSRAATADEADGDWYFDVREGFTDFEIKSVLSAAAIPYKRSEGAQKEIDSEKVAKVFKSYRFYALTAYHVVKNRKVTTIAATDQYPIFVWDEGDFKKIYQPFSPDKGRRFIYHGKRPKDFLHGFAAANSAYQANIPEGDQTIDEESGEVNQPDPEKLPELFYCSGGSDGMNIAMLGYQVVWPNSETANLSEKQFKRLTKIAKKVINVPDIDSTGRRAAHELAMQHLELCTMYLPAELASRKDRRGNACKDLRDYLNHYSAYDFKNMIPTALPYQFWVRTYKAVKSANGDKEYVPSYQLKNTRMYNFLAQNGFARIELENDKEGYIYIHIEGNIVRQVRANEIKNYIHDFLKSQNADEELRDAFFRSTQLAASSMSNLPIVEIDFTDYNKDSQYFFYENRTIKVTKSEIKEFKPGQVDRFVWEDEVIKHPINLQDPHFTITGSDGEYDIDIHKTDNHFLNYLIQTSRVFWRKELETELEDKSDAEREEYWEKHKFDISGPNLSAMEIREQKQHLINKIFCIGYLLHRYKDPSRPWCVFAMDHRIGDDGESHGGSGKSVCFKAIRNFMKSVTLDGRKSKLTEDNFIYENVNRHTDYILIDDGNQYLDFQFFFAPLTGDLTVNPKNNQRFEIPFAEVPKFAITSNFVVRNLDSSTERRLLYAVFSDYYHQNQNDFYLETRTPKDDFGKNIVNEDFTRVEWNDFYNFMMQCCQFYMSVKDKIEPPMNNVEKRNLQSTMGAEFMEWAEVYFSPESDRLNKNVIKQDAYEDFKRSSKVNIKTNRFKKSLQAFCKYHGYIFNPADIADKSGRIIQAIDVDGNKQAMEHVHLRTTQATAPPQEKEKLNEF